MTRRTLLARRAALCCGTILATVRARRWIVALVVALVALAVCGVSVATSAGSISVATHCGPPSATTIAADGRVRVYALHQNFYGCSVEQGRSFRLGHAPRAVVESRIGSVAVAGDLAAYAVLSIGVDTATASVVVRRLTDDHKLKELLATRAVGVEAFQSVGSVVLMADGSVAWIGLEHSIVASRTAIEVHAAGTGGDRVLDSGPKIDPTSLRLHGSRLTWVDGRVTRHATLH
jgi:hypothetical protein